MLKIKYIILSGWFCIAFPLYAQDSFSIKNLLEESLAYAPQIKVEKARFEAAEQEYKAQSRLYLPNISADASYGIQRSKTSTLPYDTYPEKNYGVTLTQDIYTGGRFPAQIDRSLLQFHYAVATYKDVKNKMAAQFIELYTQIYNNLEAQKLNQKNIALLQHSVKQLTALIQGGEAIPNDKIQAEVRLALEEAEKYRILADYTALSQKFKGMIGYVPPAKLEDPKDFCHITDEKSVLLTHIEAHNPALKRASLNIKMAEQDIDIAESQNMPNLSLVARSDYTDGQSAFFRSKAQTSSATLQLQFPIFDKGMSYPMIRRAEALKKAEKAELDQIRHEIYSQFEQDYALIKALEYLIKASEKALISTEKHLDQIKNEHKLGFKTYYDVLEVQRDVMRAHSDILDRQMQKTSLECRIIAIQGKFAQDIQPKK